MTSQLDDFLPTVHWRIFLVKNIPSRIKLCSSVTVISIIIFRNKVHSVFSLPRKSSMMANQKKLDSHFTMCHECIKWDFVHLHCIALLSNYCNTSTLHLLFHKAK